MSRPRPFRIMLYLVMYITGYVHSIIHCLEWARVWDSSIAGGRWAFSCVGSAKPLEGSAERNLVVGASRWWGQGSRLWRPGRFSKWWKAPLTTKSERSNVIKCHGGTFTRPDFWGCSYVSLPEVPIILCPRCFVGTLKLWTLSLTQAGKESH